MLVEPSLNNYAKALVFDRGRLIQIALRLFQLFRAGVQ